MNEITPPAAVAEESLSAIAKRVRQRERKNRTDQLAHVKRQAADVLTARLACPHGKWKEWCEEADLSKSYAWKLAEYGKVSYTKPFAELSEEGQWEVWQHIQGNIDEEEEPETSALPETPAPSQDQETAEQPEPTPEPPAEASKSAPQPTEEKTNPATSVPQPTTSTTAPSPTELPTPPAPPVVNPERPTYSTMPEGPPIRMKYTNKDGERTVRRIVPKGFRFLEGTWVVDAIDHETGDACAFVLVRIHDWAQEKPAKPRPRTPLTGLLDGRTDPSFAPDKYRCEQCKGREVVTFRCVHCWERCEAWSAQEDKRLEKATKEEPTP